MTCHAKKIIFAFICVFAYANAVATLTFNIDPHKEECFYEEAQVEDPISGSYQVATGGYLDVDTKVVGPDDKILYSGERESEGSFAFIAKKQGIYRFCFSNKMSTLTEKTVSFTLSIGEQNSANKVAKQEDLTPLEKSILKLSDGLHMVQAEQKYMRMRERVHRNTTESTNARVLWWSFFEAVLLVAMSLWQIYYLRRFFEVKAVV
eukprot:GFYU01003818.1.p1 GENE.GFYU01003818.1~~GFYU01003818.1.p1  ORF type:complete len:206 (+),score=53.02 GFYU01003818.1:94-711(+)